MRLPGSDDDKNRMSPHLLTALVSAGVVILLILAVVIGSNRKPSASGSGAGSAQSPSPGASGEETVPARPSDQGPVPAASQDALNDSPTAPTFLQALKGYFTFSPVNGSMYSFMLIWSSAISSWSCVRIYSAIFFWFFPIVDT